MPKHITFVHNNTKHESRIDYVSLPLSWQDKVTDVGLFHIDLFNKQDDHFAQPYVKIKLLDNLLPHHRLWGHKLLKPNDLTPQCPIAIKLLGFTISAC